MALASLLGRQSAKAQETAQEILNELRITATGDVHVGQHAAGTQLVYTDARGNRYYAGDTVQVIENNGRITATGDVWVEQETAGGQQVTTEVITPAYVGQTCMPGMVRFNGYAGGNNTWLALGADCEWYDFNICAALQSLCGGK